MYVEKPNKNKDLNISKVKMNCDEIICDSKGRTVPYPLMKTAFAMVINGFSGSGKTTILMNLLTRKNKNNNKLSYRGCFETIIFCSPSLHTIHHKMFDELEYVFDTLDSDVMDFVESTNQNI